MMESVAEGSMTENRELFTVFLRRLERLFQNLKTSTDAILGFQLIHAIYFLTTASDLKRYHLLSKRCLVCLRGALRRGSMDQWRKRRVVLVTVKQNTVSKLE